MSKHDTFKVRCRAIIRHAGKMLVVKHTPEATFWALPGGHLEHGEGIEECFKREIVEELGILPVIDHLAYVHSFIDPNGEQSIEFFFEVANAEAYLQIDSFDRTHAHEINNILWALPTDDIRILPKKVDTDFKAGVLANEKTIFVNEMAGN